MMELLKTVVRLPLVTMAELTGVFLNSLRELQGAIESSLSLVEQQVDVRQLKESSQTIDKDNLEYGCVTSAEELLYRSGIGHGIRAIEQTTLCANSNSEGNKMNYDTSNYDNDEWFGDRNFVKTYEYSVTYVGEGDLAILDSGEDTTDSDTSEKSVKDEHRRKIIKKLKKANNKSDLPRAWKKEPPSFLKVDPNTGAIDKSTQEYRDFIRDLNDNVEASIRRISRHRVKSPRDERRQSKALEGIDEKLGRIEKDGLKSRQY
jgi:hypothetical protein